MNLDISSNQKQTDIVIRLESTESYDISGSIIEITSCDIVNMVEILGAISKTTVVRVEDFFIFPEGDGGQWEKIYQETIGEFNLNTKDGIRFILTLKQK